MSGTVESKRTGRRRGQISDGFGRLDLSFLFIIFFLLAFGLVILYSASYYEASMSSTCGYDAAYYLKRQAVWMVFGVVVMYAVSFVPYGLYRKIAKYLFFISLILVCCCTFFPESNGAKRWIYIGGMSLQPAELVKITTILLVAGLICHYGQGLAFFRYSARTLMFPLIASVLIYGITKNLSSAAIVFMIAFAMVYVGRPDYLKPLLVVLAGAALVVLAVWYLLYTYDSGTNTSYRVARIMTWLDPEGNAGDTGYQTLQALYAIGSGGLFGRGLGNSMQKLGYIPEVQNDMIFSVICEELGMFGALAVIVMFILLCWRLMVIADNAPDAYSGYIVVGVFCHIAVQVILNIAVVTNTIPNTGVTLPFISYGGSSVLFTMAEMGIVLNVMRNIPD